MLKLLMLLFGTIITVQRHELFFWRRYGNRKGSVRTGAMYGKGESDHEAKRDSGTAAANGQAEAEAAEETGPVCGGFAFPVDFGSGFWRRFSGRFFLAEEYGKGAVSGERRDGYCREDRKSVV